MAKWRKTRKRGQTPSSSRPSPPPVTPPPPPPKTGPEETVVRVVDQERESPEPETPEDPGVAPDTGPPLAGPAVEAPTMQVIVESTQVGWKTSAYYHRVLVNNKKKLLVLVFDRRYKGGSVSAPSDEGVEMMMVISSLPKLIFQVQTGVSFDDNDTVYIPFKILECREVPEGGGPSPFQMASEGL